MPDVTILATQEMQKTLAATPTITISGSLEYQSCDDKLCYNPPVCRSASR